MTISISKERLEKIASWRDRYGPNENVVIPAEEAEEMARYILALQEQEPVAVVGTDSANLAIVKLADAPEGALLYPAPPRLD